MLLSDSAVSYFLQRYIVYRGILYSSTGATSEYPPTPFTCVGVLSRTRNITIVAILIQ